MADLGMRNFRMNYMGDGRWLIAYQAITGPTTAQTRTVPISFEEAKVFTKHFNAACTEIIDERAKKGFEHIWLGTTLKIDATPDTSTSHGTTPTKCGVSEETTPTTPTRSSISDTSNAGLKDCKRQSSSLPSSSGQRSRAKASKEKSGKTQTTTEVAAGRPKKAK